MQQPKSRGPAGAISGLVTLLVVVVAWFTVGPSSLGGPTTFLTTSGTSMQPRFHTGDLAIVRRASDYHVGDIVAYHLTAQSLVLHRIIARDGDRFVMKGDNNGWTDSTEPRPADIAGRLWIHVPGFGGLLTALRMPLIIGGSAAAIAIVLLGGDDKKKKRAARQAGSRMIDGSRISQHVRLAVKKEDLLAGALAAGIAALVLAFIAFARPLTKTGSGAIDYQQGGTFGYSADVPGSIYDGGEVAAGQPVFLHIVNDLNANFAYRFHSDASHQLHGTYSLALQLSQESGWQRRAVLIPDTAFSGDNARMSADVSLADVQAAMSAFESQTGIKGGEFSLTLLPVVQVAGTLAGAPFNEHYAPQLPFALNATDLTLAKNSDGPDLLHPLATGVVPRPRQQTNTLGLFGVELPVLGVRVAALALLLVSAAVLIAVFRSAGAAQETDESSRIEARYGSLLVHMQGSVAGIGEVRSLIDALSIDDLVRAAEQRGRPILHSRGDGVDRYFVTDGDTVYRYTTLAPSQPEQAPSQRQAAG